MDSQMSNLQITYLLDMIMNARTFLWVVALAAIVQVGLLVGIFGQLHKLNKSRKK